MKCLKLVLTPFSFFFLVCISTNLYSQIVSKSWVYDRIQTTLKNKVKGDLEAILQLEDFNTLERSGSSQQIPDGLEFRNEDIGISQTTETESEIHAAVNPADTNNIIVAAMKFTEGQIANNLTFPIYYTNDFGASWNLSSFDGVNDLPTGTLVAGGGDPVIVFDSEGTAYLSWLTLTVDFTFTFKISLNWAVSTDGGATWERQESTIDEGTVIDFENPDSRFVDKQWMAVDQSDSQFKDNIYTAYAEIDLTDTTYNILVKHKSVEANDFSDPVELTSDDYLFAQFSSIDVDADGGIHVLFAGGRASDQAFGLFHSHSSDGGQSFSAPVRISTFSLTCFPPGAGVECDLVGIDSNRVYPSPHLKVDKSGGLYDGRIYAVWTANGQNVIETSGTDIYFSTSDDEGATWSTPIVLNDDDNPDLHQFFPSLTINEFGTLVITWYDRREDPNNLMTQFFMTFSTDGGQNFEPNFAVSSVASDFSVIGQSNANFGIGEYTQVVSTGTYAIPFWADGRTNDGNIEIFTALIPIDGSPVVGVEEMQNLSTQFSVNGPYPSPATNEAQLEIELKEDAQVQVLLLSADGQLLSVINNGRLKSGLHSFNLKVEQLPEGQYYCSIVTDFGFKTKVVTVAR